MPLTFDRLMEIVRTGTEGELAGEERAEYERFVRRVGIRREGVAGSVPAPAVADPAPAAVATPNRRRWAVWAAIAASASVGVGATVFALVRDREAGLVAADRDRIARELAEAQAKLDATPVRPPSDRPLRPTTDPANAPLDWQATLKEHYDDKLTPEENLDVLIAVSGGVKAEAARMRTEKPDVTAKQILAAMFAAWGPPKR